MKILRISIMKYLKKLLFYWNECLFQKFIYYLTIFLKFQKIVTDGVTCPCITAAVIGTKKYYVCIINIKFSNHTCVCKVSIPLHFLISVNLPGCIALELWKILRFHLVNSLFSLKNGCWFFCPQRRCLIVNVLVMSKTF